MRTGTLPYFNALADTRRCLPCTIIICAGRNYVNEVFENKYRQNASHGETHLYVVFVRRNQTCRPQAVFNQVLRLFISFAIINIACFCDGVNVTHCSIRGFKSGVNSIISPSAKN